MRTAMCRTHVDAQAIRDLGPLDFGHCARYLTRVLARSFQAEVDDAYFPERATGDLVDLGGRGAAAARNRQLDGLRDCGPAFGVATDAHPRDDSPGAPVDRPRGPV